MGHGHGPGLGGGGGEDCDPRLKMENIPPLFWDVASSVLMLLSISCLVFFRPVTVRG